MRTWFPASLCTSIHPHARRYFRNTGSLATVNNEYTGLCSRLDKFLMVASK